MADEPYAVGYGKPPRHSQFQKGRSGNPRGRPRKGESIEDLLERELDEKVTAVVNGRKRKILKREAIVKTFVNGLMKGGAVGNNRILFDLAERRRQRQEWLDYLQQEEDVDDQPIVVTMDFGNPERDLKIAQVKYDRWLIEQERKGGQ